MLLLQYGFYGFIIGLRGSFDDKAYINAAVFFTLRRGILRRLNRPRLSKAADGKQGFTGMIAQRREFGGAGNMQIPVIPDFNSAVGREPPISLDIVIAKRLVIGMPFHKDRVEDFIAILLDDHAADGITDVIDDLLGTFWNHEIARIKFQQPVGDANHTVIFTDLDHDVFCLQLRLDLAQHPFKRLLDLLDPLDFLYHCLAVGAKLQAKRH